LRLLVRSWNLFHGNSLPPEPRSHLEEMVRLVTADGPDVVCLQEVPAWALERLDEWSGMSAVGDVAARPAIGPLPITAELGRRLTQIDHGLLRSAFSGQANAILLAPALRLRDRHLLVLNPRPFRRRTAVRLGLDVVERLAWAKERRVCQAVRVEQGKETALLANLHTTAIADPRVPDAELLRAATFADALARPDEPLVLAGDFNVHPGTSSTLAELATWGFSAPASRIDHVLVRGADAGALLEWDEPRRVVGGRLLSDHAPVELSLS
jgi:endonuclease/exonuclease/phosphatase family metal-dependent hydrolase